MLTWEMGHVVLIRFSTSRAVLLHRNITIWKLQMCFSVRRLSLYCHSAWTGINGALHLLRKCSAPFSFGQCSSWKDSKLETMFSFNSQTCWKTKHASHSTEVSGFCLFLHFRSLPVPFGRKGRACVCVCIVCFPPWVLSSRLSDTERCSPCVTVRLLLCPVTKCLLAY